MPRCCHPAPFFGATGVNPAESEDHKPDTPGERERLEAAGSEVRQAGTRDASLCPVLDLVVQVDVESYRIYIKGTNFPGLTMRGIQGLEKMFSDLFLQNWHS